MNIIDRTFLSNYPQLLLCEIGTNGDIFFITDVLREILTQQNAIVCQCQTQSLYSYLHPDDAINARNLIESCVAGQLSETEFDARLQKNPDIVLHFSGTRKDGKCYLSAQDVSHMNRDDSIREQVNKLANIATGISMIGHWYFNVDEARLIWSNEVYAIHGISKGEYFPEIDSASEFYHPEDVGYVKDMIKQSLQTGKEWEGRLRIVRPDGEVRSVVVANNAIFDKQGNVITLFGVIQDVTTAEQVEHERELMAGAFESTHLGLVITDVKRRVLYANQGFEKLTGYSSTEVSGRNLGHVMQGMKTNQKTVKSIRESLSHAKKVDCTILNYTKDKTPYWNHLIITPVFRHGKLVNYVGVQQDVTEEVQTRQEIDDLNNSLEHIVSERTEKLEEANEKLKRISVEDPLTGALNRRAFYQSYNTEIKRAGRSGQPLSMALMDLDHFKKINDKYGHLIGDKVLKSVVEIINDNMRETDYLFRMGGEEFILLMSNTGMVQAKIVCERIRTSIDAHKVTLEDDVITVTLSVGLISHYGNIGVSEALKLVDESMYSAKQLGRNNIVCHSPQIKERS